MGETYLARAGGKLVMLERLPRSRAGDAAAVKAFLEAARAGAQLSHENVATVIDAGRLGSSYFVAIEYIDGESLHSVLEHAKAQGRLQVPLRAVLTIGAGIASALHHAHERKSGDGTPGIVHGNLSPSSVFISRDGGVKVMDFGAPGGPLAYRSPEQLAGGTVDARTDLFALGAVLYELLTREPVFGRDSDEDTRAAIESDVRPSPSKTRMDVPAELDAIVGKLLSRDPEKRYADADDVLVDFEALATKLGFPISATDLARVVRIWFGASVKLAALEVAATVESDELSSDAGANADEIDRAFERVPGLGVALFESEDDGETEEQRRAANPTPPPFDVPDESFETIRDRMASARKEPDAAAARAHAYTSAPVTGRAQTIPGVFPSAIDDVIKRVTQAASERGAAARETAAAVLGPGPGERPSEPLIERVEEKELEAPPLAARVATEEPVSSRAVTRQGDPTDAAKLMAQAEAAENSADKLAAAKAEYKAAAEEKEKQKEAEKAPDEKRPKSDSTKPEDKRSRRESKRQRNESKKLERSKSPTKKPEDVVSMSRTLSSEWYEQGEKEAKEAHAAHARFHVHDDDHDHDHDPEAHRRARRRGLLYPLLGLAAATLVVIALVTIATREHGSKVHHDAKQVAVAPADAAETGSAIGSDLAGSGSAVAMVGSDMTGSGSAMVGSDVGSAVAMGSAVVVADAAVDAKPDAPVDAAKPDAPVDAAKPIDAAKPDAAVRVDAAVPVDAAPKPDAAIVVKKPDTTKKPDKTKKPDETKKPAEPDTIETLYAKGAFAKANQMCATNTRFNPARLEMCALAACNVKDSALATRWLHAVDHSAREGIIAKCKDLGVELTAP